MYEPNSQLITRELTTIIFSLFSIIDSRVTHSNGIMVVSLIFDSSPTEVGW